jgi:hypothetical protein
MKSKELKKTVKYFKKNKKEIYKAIIPVVIFCLIITIIGILIPRPNDNVTPSKKGYLFENHNPTFNVAFGSKEDIDKSYVRFEAKTSDNPFEQKEQSFWDNVTQIFSQKKGIEFGLSEIRFSETNSEIGKKITEQIGSAIEQMEIDDVITDTEVIEVGRLLGEDTDVHSKKTVINKDVYPGIDLEYQILEDLGVKEEIVIRNIDEYTSNCGTDAECLLPLNEFVFDLKLDDGLQLKQSMAVIRNKVENTYYITDENDNYIAHFLPTFAVDEAGSKTSGVSFDVSNVEDNNYEMTIILDPDWLFSNQRVFPIRIDPSIVHDTTTEFDTGSDYNTEVNTGPKIEIEDPEVYYTDSNVVGYWKLDDDTESIVSDDSNLEAYWDLKETGTTIYDKSTNTNNGSATGTSSVDAVIGNGRSFNGSSDYISVPTNASLNITGDLTVETWIYPDDSLSTANANRWLEKGDSYFLMEGNGGVVGTGITFLVKYNNVNYYVDSGVTHSAGQWYHVVGVHDDSANLLRLYINGTQVNTTSFTGTIDNDNLALRIGSDDSGLYFDGMMDEVAIYSTALSPTEIEARYEAGLEMKDASGNDNHGLTMGSDYVEDGILGGARYFNGSSDKISIENSSSLEVSTTDEITIEAWIYPMGTPTSGDRGTIVTKSLSYYMQQYVDDRIAVYTYHDGGASSGYFYSNSTVPHNQWSHVVFTENSSGYRKIYINGVLDAGGQYEASIRSYSHSIEIGAENSMRWFNGLIDEVKISNVARSADEIQRSYQIGYEKMIQGAHTSAELDFGSTADIESVSWIPVGDNTGNGEIPYSTTSLIGQWDFNETSGTTADNEGSCGSSCDGTLTNFSSTTGQDVVAGSGWTSDNRRWGTGALMFDGTDDYVSTTQTATDLGVNGSASRTVNVWVYTQTFNHGGIFEMGTQSVGEDFSLRTMTTDNEWRAQFWGIDVDFTYESKNRWVYFSLVYDGSYAYVYADGVQIESYPVALNTTNTKTFTIGRWSTYYFDGVIDSLTLYSRALSSSEILSNYQSGNIEMRYRASEDSSTWTEWSGTETVIGDLNDDYMYDVDSSNLVAYYPMDDNLTSIIPADSTLEGYWDFIESSGSGAYIEDKSTNSNDGTPNGSTYSNGKIDGGRTFNGSTDYINIPNDSSLTFERTDSFSLEMWFKADGSISSTQSILSKMNITDENGYEIFIYNNDIWFLLSSTWDTNCIAVYADGVTVTDGSWHHIVTTYDGTSSASGVTMYIDGSSRTLTTYRNNLSATTVESNPVTIGARTGGLYFDGDVDEVGIYSKELTSAEASVRYKAGLEIRDSSGNNNSAAPYGTNVIDGKFQDARRFDGTNDYISTSADIDYGTGTQITVAAWISFHNCTGSDGVCYIVSKNQYNGATPYTLLVSSSGQIRIAIQGSSVNSIEGFNDGKWHYAVGTLNGTTASIYVDGHLQASGTVSPASNDEYIVIGSDDADSTYRPFNGAIDEVEIYDVALTASQIYAKFLEGSSQSVINTKTAALSIEGDNALEIDIQYDFVDGNTAGYWHLDESSGSGAYLLDESYNGNNGTPSGTTYSANGKYNGARYFDGVDDTITTSLDTAADSLYAASGYTWTVECWFNYTSGLTDDGVLVGLGGGTGTSATFALFIDTSNQLRSVIRGTYTTLETGVNDGKWNHIAVTWNGSNGYYYYNGVYGGSLSIGTVSVQSHTVSFGASGSGTIKYFEGYLDEIKISDVARSSAEIRQSYRWGKGSYISQPIDETNISSDSVLPIWFASDELGNNMSVTYGESAYANYEPDANTIGLWRFDEERTGSYTEDDSGYINHGTATGTTFVGDGVLGGAKEFNGSSDWVDLGDLGDPSAGTIDFWVKLDVVNSGGQYLFDGRDTGNWWFLQDYTSGACTDTEGNICFDARVEIPSSMLSSNTWYYVTITTNSTESQAFLNGQLVATGSGEDPSFESVRIGTRYTNSSYFAGQMDEVRISNTIRSADEILQAYEIGKRTHSVTVDFKADLESSNLISSSADTLFTISEQDYGTSEYIENIDVGEKIIIKETDSGTEYFAQGDVATVNTSTGAVTVNSWDSDSTFPSSGYTTGATVFKWQREYVDVRYLLAEDIDSISNLTFKKITDTVATFWIDDIRKASYMTDYDASTLESDYLYSSSDTDLIAYYPMDETSGSTVNDIARENNGTAAGTTIVDAYNNKGRNFAGDGSGDIIDCGSSTDLEPTTELTVSAWVYAESGPDAQGRTALSKYDYDSAETDNGWNFGATWTTDEFNFRVYGPTNGGSVAESNFFANNLNTWVHMVGVFDGSNFIKLYKNGVLIGTDAVDVPAYIDYTEDSSLIIGRRSVETQSYWDGSIDEVRIYDRALTADEVSLLYDATSTRYVQYQAIFTKWDNNTGLDLYLTEVEITYSSGPTMDQLMRHGKWFNSSGVEQPFWWVGN